jgi:iron complex outermembrane receptor protein
MAIRLWRANLFGACWAALIGGTLFAQVARADEVPLQLDNAVQEEEASRSPVAPVVQRATRPKARSVSLQPPMPPGTTPTVPALPETEVVAEPQPAQGPAPAANNNPYPSVLRGTIFASPPVTGYNAPTSTVGTMVDVPNRIFPGTINTITRDVIRDQQILSMDEALRDIAGAVKSFGGDGVIRQDQFFIRGFEATSQTFRRDGYLDPSYVPRDVANIERIDVLKGPASVLYGAAQPTGTFNIVTKKPMLDPYLWGGVTYGSFGLQRYAFDANSAVTADKSVLIRITGAYQHADSFRQTVFQEREFISPVVSWAMDDDTSLTWAGEYQHDRFRLDQGVPALNGDPFAVSRKTFTGDPNGDVGDYRNYRSTLTFQKILNDNWTLRIGEMSLWYNTPSTTSFLDNGSVGANGLLNSPLIGRDQTVANPFQEQNHDILETLGGEFDGYLFSHKAVIGAEQDWFITNHDTFTQTTNFLGGSSFAPINVTQPGPFPLGPPSPFTGQNVFDNPAFRQNRFGFFAQDIIDLTPQLHLLLGGRFDYMTQTYSRSDTVTFGGFPVTGTGDVHTEDTFSRFSPRAGLTYDLIPDTMSIYGMYSKSFTPSIGVANFSPGVRLLPQIGDIWEGGFKAQLTDRILWTTAGWWTRQHNVTVEQFNPAGGGGLAFFATQAGIQRSQGVETSVTGQITDRLSTISNFAYTDAFLYGVAQSATGFAPPIDRTRVRGVPLWTGNTWVRYNFVQEQGRTIGGALGMRYVGTRLGDYSSPLSLPSFDVWDIGCYYNRGRLGAMVLWDNIFNINYAVSSISQYQVIPGAPSNVRVQFTATF